MKQALGNSCLKGCLIYVVALAIILAVSAAGFGGLGARFGAGAQNGKPEQAANQAAPGKGGAPASGAATNGNPQAPAPANEQASSQAEVQAQAQGVQVNEKLAAAPSGPAAVPSAPTPIQAEQPIPDQSSSPATAPEGDSAPQVQAQGGVVTGQASVPFYIVQPGDTLWQIALTYGTKVDTLRAINKLGENVIKPGQLLYLPQAGENTQAPGPVPDAPPPVQAPTDQGAENPPAPSMPGTGANAQP